MDSLEERLKAEARRLGFDLVGIAPAVAPPGYSRFEDWLRRGFAGDMAYMEKHHAARAAPDSVLPDVRSLIVVGLNYHVADGRVSEATRSQPSALSAPLTGRISRYARIRDYHDLVRQRLKLLLKWLQEEVPGCNGRVVVDTAPLLERDYARLAGLGWFGKNTMLLNKRWGSWYFLGALLVNLALRPDSPHDTSHCGTCTACLDACPTQAFPEPGVLDARKCISYVTIELRKPIPLELREKLGDWVFGCDVCQDVCPWNRKVPVTKDPELLPLSFLETPDLLQWLSLTREQFRERFRGTPLTRPGRAGLLRNVAIVLGNRGDPAAIPALLRALNDDESLVRGAAAWALGQYLRRGTDTGRLKQALLDRLTGETDLSVREELERALSSAA
ncbi:MAG: tRNA epoxyqueuosine(34) reductase QueG [Gemmatales bacterium]|nr:tRNA epoxyqueuosine(34) reductase QueG [Gemmatales bacterium]MDW8388404.1 tRNA epoxyqueuosine(34) reductase QueG [Gemmatales bacterium]